MNIILFDGICNLCNGVVLFIIRRDKKALFRFAPMQSLVGKSLMKQYGIRDESNSTLYYIREDKYFRKSAAMIYILRDLGGIWRYFYPLIFIPPCIRDLIYLFISRNRYRLFGKRQTCMIPTEDIKERFLV